MARGSTLVAAHTSAWWRRAVRISRSLVIATVLGIAANAIAFPAHYFVVSEARDGTLSIVSHAIVDLAGTPETTTSLPRENGFEDFLLANVRSKDSGQDVFATVAAAARWSRAEYHGSGQIDGRTLPVDSLTYVVRVPVTERSVLQLFGARTQRLPRAAAAGNSLDIDLDSLLPPGRVVPNALPAGASTGFLEQNGDPANRLDLLIVAEGYTSGQQSKFVADAQKLANAFFSGTPYQEFRHLMNVAWLFVPSNQAGADKPACTDPDTPAHAIVMVDTAFDATFCNVAGVWRNIGVNNQKVFTVAANVPDWDNIVVIVNDTTYGGSGGPIAVVTVDPAATDVVAHEIGHSFSHLADEYDSVTPGYPPCSDLTTTAPCEANVTDQTVRSDLKWAGWVAAATPIPTAAPLADPIGAGLWLGARYRPTGMYRQCYDGKMRSLGRPFCHVDSEAFVKRLYAGWSGVPAAGVSLIEPNATPGASLVTAPPASTVAFSAVLAGSLAPSALSYEWRVDGVVASAGTSAHGATQTFAFVVPDASTHTVELRVRDATPLLLVPHTRSQTWTVNGSTPSTGLGTATITVNPYGSLSISGATLSGNKISSFGQNVTIQLGSIPGSAGSFAEFDFAGIGLANGKTFTFRSGAPGQTVLMRNVDSSTSTAIDGVLQAQGGTGAPPPVLVLQDPSGITVNATGLLLAQAGITLDALDNTGNAGKNVVNLGQIDGGASLVVKGGGVRGGGRFAGDNQLISTFGNANNPVNGNHFLANGLQLSPSSGARVSLALNHYGKAPQFWNLMINGDGVVSMPTLWSGSLIGLPFNNRPVPALGVRPPGTGEPPYGGGSIIVQAAGKLTLAAGGSADFVFPGGVVLKAGSTLDLNGVTVNQGWTTAGRAFQGIYFEAPDIVTPTLTNIFSNDLNWTNFSTVPAGRFRISTLRQQADGSATYVAADDVAPHQNVYSILVETAANGQCWVCLVNYNAIDVR